MTSIYLIIMCQALNQAQIITETRVETTTEGHTNMPNFNNVESETEWLRNLVAQLVSGGDEISTQAALLQSFTLAHFVFFL